MRFSIMAVKMRIGSVVACCLAATFVLLASSSSAVAATEAQIEEMIVDGLAWLADPAQKNSDGVWGDGSCDRVATTGLVLLKFEHRAYELGFGDPTDSGYQYHQEVIDGLAYIMSQKREGVDISGESAADGNSNGTGTYFNDCPGTRDVYNTGCAMMGIAGSRNATYTFDLQETVDWMSFAQANPACGQHRGGWGYVANQCYDPYWPDNSNGGYASLGLGFAASNSPPYEFGLTIPSFVEDELSLWIDALQDSGGGHDNGGSWYRAGVNSWVNILKTGNLLYEMRLVDDPPGKQRVQDAIDYIERAWNDTGGGGSGWRNHRQAMFTMMKGLEAFDIHLIGAIDWFDEVSTHLWDTRVGVNDDHWPNDPWGDDILSTAWALLTLEKIVPEPPPLPTVSEWGLAVITLLLLTGISIKFGRRRGSAKAA